LSTAGRTLYGPSLRLFHNGRIGMTLLEITAAARYGAAPSQAG